MINSISKRFHILKLVYQYGTISIKTLSSLTHLSIPHVTHYVEALLRDHLLCEKTQTTVTTGRKPKLFSLNPAYGYIVGVDMGLISTINIGFFDLTGCLIDQISLSLKKESLGEVIIEDLIQSIHRGIEKNGLSSRRLLCIVIGNPGVVDPETGAIQFMSADSAKWGHLPLKKMFQDQFATHAIVLNDVNLCAIGEKEFGMGKGYKNFIFIRNEIGMKAGIIIKNHLYQGETGAAGEIGLNVMISPPNAHQAYCSILPVESMLSLNAIYTTIANQLSSHTDDPYYFAVNGDPELVNADSIAKILGRGSYVDDIIFHRGCLFGHMLINIATTLDIALIIVSGDVVKLNNYFFKPVRDVLSQYLQAPPTVLVSSLGDSVTLFGAYGVGLEYILDCQKSL